MRALRHSLPGGANLSLAARSVVRGALARAVLAFTAFALSTSSGFADWEYAPRQQPSEGSMFGMARGKYGPIVFLCWDERSTTGDWTSEIVWVTNTPIPAGRKLDTAFIRGRIIVDGDFFGEVNFRKTPFPRTESQRKFLSYHTVHYNFSTVKRLFDGLALAKRSVEIKIGDESAMYSVGGLQDALAGMLSDCGIETGRYDG